VISLSSIESMISDIERDFKEVLDMFESGVIKDTYYRFKEVSEDDVFALLREVMSFQRRIEQNLASVERMVGKSARAMGAITEEEFQEKRKKLLDTI